MRYYCYFDTAIGLCGFLWNDRAIERARLPEKNQAELRKQLIHKVPKHEERNLDEAPAFVQDAALRLRKLFSHGHGDLTSIPVDLSECSDFFRRVYEYVRTIPPGRTMTYGEIAKALDSPGAARAVGQAMGRNPIPPIVPCHRVLAAGGKPGGFSAYGGLITKQQILAIEEAGALDWHQDFPGAAAQAVTYLKKQDPTLGRLIDLVGSCRLLPKRGTSVFAALAEAIVYQQLHAKAAGTIFGRFRALYPTDAFPTPAAVLDTSDELLRSAGLSRSKLLSLKDLASKIQSGAIPEMQELAAMSDEAVIEVLTQVRGIGPWTAEMLLIFDLGRVDILPVTDYGVRKGYSVAYRKRDLPSHENLARHGELWKPYRSLASWYLWRAADLKTME